MTHLLSLPPEILYTILTSLEPAHSLTQPLTLLDVAATCKHLYAIVEEHANNALKKHQLPLPKRLAKHSTLRRKWLRDICQFCKRPSTRHACFYDEVVCCKGCDRTLFPKMTMTQAIQSHHLSKLDLFTPNLLHPHLPELRLGASNTLGGQTTLISEPDVLARREYLYALRKCARGASPTGLRHGPPAHNRIIEHLRIVFNPFYRRWCSDKKPVTEKMAVSMRTIDQRGTYVRRHLLTTWMELGIDPCDAGEVPDLRALMERIEAASYTPSGLFEWNSVGGPAA
ncbi:hypothetical protein T440DRAFT_463579 [Plenodomus tracheiphilus IPT5]|uniref:F-box domain-containing protein n=1 Tax=Plenodomus tracheiphilus IPT5 TaxID=1408161 RepID=A0A6A7BLP3_9PLEO|nr:hypothetical protein T440DRAFT_463579 [Plenodomus tracheiphilus IPT5]